jgi:D-tyrosyl-tRNA(Tyr) deacylase
MIGLIQRVTQAVVTVEGAEVGAIERGLLVLVGVQHGDTVRTAQRLAERLVGYRVFADEQGRMNLSARDVHAAVLLVPQFTLAADTNSGMRPSFSSAAAPTEARARFDELVAGVAALGARVARGQFGADMQVTSTNDGPVTFWLEVPPEA